MCDGHVDNRNTIGTDFSSVTDDSSSLEDRQFRSVGSEPSNDGVAGTVKMGSPRRYFAVGYWRYDEPRLV